MNKLKNESGAALLLAIFLLILVSIVMISFSTQVGNQVKSTMNLNRDIQAKYDAESIIEEGIADFIKTIKVVKENESYFLTYDNSKFIYKENDTGKIAINSNTDVIGLDIRFDEIPNKSSYIKIKVSNIDDENNYKISYDILSWRN